VGLAKSKSVNKKGILLQGGEPLLHPNFEEIMQIFKKENIRNIVILSNGVLTDRLIKIVEKYKVGHITISLDGAKSNYKLVRGIDAYDNVVKSIDMLKGKTKLSVCFTISPWNTYEDYLHVKKLCEERNIRFMTNIYSRMEYTGKPNEESLIDSHFEQDPNPYIRLYNSWKRGKIYIPCLAMRFLAVIRPDADVTLCQCKEDVVLGNLYENSFDEIWNSEKTKSIQRKNRFCNDCWVASHRPFDIKFSLLMKRLLPARLANKILKSL
jgi:MoaA/NifB/PqqE/SkfB family radical SAM enzyme